MILWKKNNYYSLFSPIKILCSATLPNASDLLALPTKYTTPRRLDVNTNTPRGNAHTESTSAATSIIGLFEFRSPTI